MMPVATTSRAPEQSSEDVTEVVDTSELAGCHLVKLGSEKSHSVLNTTQDDESSGSCSQGKYC